MSMKHAAYWAATGLFALALGAGGLADAMLVDAMREAMGHLGYPEYFARILGTWKILGVIAILVPGFPLVKQWAYAGFTFALTGAALSHFAIGDVAGIGAPLFLLAIGAVSYGLHQDARAIELPVARAPATA